MLRGLPIVPTFPCCICASGSELFKSRNVACRVKVQPAPSSWEMMALCLAPPPSLFLAALTDLPKLSGKATGSHCAMHGRMKCDRISFVLSSPGVQQRFLFGNAASEVAQQGADSAPLASQEGNQCSS